MKNSVDKVLPAAPFFNPFRRRTVLAKNKAIIREEISRSSNQPTNATSELQIPGLTYKPLYRVAEVCTSFK